jgi:hypothetical protein
MKEDGCGKTENKEVRMRRMEYSFLKEKMKENECG